MRSRRGMSILEVMIVIAIIIFLSFITWAVMESTFETRDLLAERDDMTRSARVTLAKVRRELQLAYLTKYPEAINTYETVFVGIDDNPDRLTFTSLAHQRLYRDSRECDQTELTYWLEDSGDGSPGYTLYHRESPRVDDEPDRDGVIQPLAYNVRTFNIRYLDSRTNEWFDVWDSRSVDQSQRLPRAVQIGLVLILEEKDGNDKKTYDIPFMTTVFLEYAEPLAKDAASGPTINTDPDSSTTNPNPNGNGNTSVPTRPTTPPGGFR